MSRASLQLICRVLGLLSWPYYVAGNSSADEDGIIKEYDANGNYISIANVCEDEGCSQLHTSIYDASNREIRIDYNTTDANLSTDVLKRDLVTAPGPNGTVTYAIDWQAIEIGGVVGLDIFLERYYSGATGRFP